LINFRFLLSNFSFCFPMFSNRLYYDLKPYLPWRVRMTMRRILASRQRKKHQDVWPINEAAGQPPANWPGWPDGKQFAFVITHDVESAAGLAKCRKFMELDQQLGFRSSFNFVPEGDYAVSRELRQELVQNGFEVGVHDLHHDGKLYQSRAAFAENAKWINRYLSDWGAVGFRSGFMLREMNWLHDLDSAYDTSTFDTDPFEPQPDGAGTIFPFWVPKHLVHPMGKGVRRTGEGAVQTNSAIGKNDPFQLSAFNSPLSGKGYVELPYTLPQDSTLFLMLRESGPEIWLRKLDWIARHGGMALVNVHPDYLQFPGEPPSPKKFPVAHYIELLEHVRNRYAGAYWQPLPQVVARLVSDRVAGQLAVQTNHRPEIVTDVWAVRERESVLVNANGNDHDSVTTAVAPVRDVSAAHPAINPVNLPLPDPATSRNGGAGQPLRLRGCRVGVLLFSHYPSDPRPKRAAEALAKEGAEVDFLCLQRNAEEPRRETVNGLNIFRVSLKRRRGGKLVYFFQYGVFISAGFVFLAWRSLGRRYHLVHVHNMPDVLVFGALIPKLLGAKVILDLHDPMPELMTTIYKLPEQSLAVRFLKQAEKWSIGFADLVLTPNIAFKNLFAARSCPADKIQIVMNSPNEETFKFRPVSSVAVPRRATDPFVILYHGSLVHRHGLDIAIDALALVRKSIPNATITICGENTPYFESVMETVKARGLTDAVHYLGMRNQQQIAAEIEQCDLGVIPNRRSVFIEINMPTRIFEYLALAKPVIAPRTRGIQDYFSEENLLFFEPDNVADLAQKMISVAERPGEIQDLIRRGQTIYQKHKWSQERTRLIEHAGRLLEA
jgi:glycosyltransferase involved in cell wall biosynthesis